MKIGLHIADFTYPAGPAGLADDLTRIVVAAEEAGFAARQRDGPPLADQRARPARARDARGLHDARLPRRAHRRRSSCSRGSPPSATAIPACSPSSSPRSTCCRKGRAWLGIGAAWNERGGQGPRPVLPAARPSASSGWRRPCRSACRCGATPTPRTRASTTSSGARSTCRSRCSARTRRSSSAAAGRRRRCGWSRSTRRPATCSPGPDLAHKLDVLRGHCET